MPFIPILEHRLEYAWFGELSARAPVVMLHEGLGSVALWRDFPGRLAAVTGRRGYQLTPQGLADGKALNELYTACYQWLVSHPDLGLLAESRVHPPDDESSPIDVLFPEPHMAGAVFEQIEADRIRLIAADRPGDIIGFHAFPLSETDPTAQRFLTAIATPAASDDTTNPIVPLPDPTTDEYGRSGVIAKMWSLNLDGIDPAAGVRDFHIAAHATPDSQDLRPSHIPWLRSATVETWDIGDPEARDAGGAAFTGIIYAAQPVYVTANVVDALAHTDPPPPEVVAAARMPHQATLLVPAHGIAPVLPPGRIDVPVTFRLGAAWDLWPAFPTWLTAAVVFANPDGSIADGVLVVLTSLIPVDHDEERLALTCHYYDTWPAPFADTLGSLATAVAIMEPDGYDTPTEAWPDGKPRKFTRSSEFRKRAARGNYVKVRVIDLDTSTHSVSPDADDPSGRSVTPHFRRGHFRRVRIGHRDDWWYETRWIPPTFVRGTGANAAVQVWRAS